MRVGVLVALAVLVISCTSEDEPGVLSGTLHGDAEAGCVWVGDPETGVEVAWPPDYDVRVDPIEVSGPAGTAQPGDVVMMRGALDADLPQREGCPHLRPGEGQWVPVEGTIEFGTPGGTS